MSALSIQPVFPIFTDTDGSPLHNGYIYIGTENLDPQNNPINVYFDKDLTISAAQPIRTNFGYPFYQGAAARLYVDSNYSISILNAIGSQVYSSPSATEQYNDNVLPNITIIPPSSDSVTYTPPFPNSVATTVQLKLAQFISVKDFGAVGNGIVDDTTSIQNAINAVLSNNGGMLFFPSGVYLISGVSVAAGITLFGEGQSILRRLPNMPNTGPMVNTNAPLWLSAVNSNAFSMINITLDGNRDNQGAYTANQLGANGCVFVQANASSQGRLTCIISQCRFIDSVSYGIGIGPNVNILVSECFANQCFNGGILQTGGASHLKLMNSSVNGRIESRGIDVNITIPGFNNTLRCCTLISNVEYNGYLRFNLTNESEGSISNLCIQEVCQYPTWDIGSTDNSPISITNSTFIIMPQSFSLNRIRFAENVKISNCNFLYTNLGQATGSTTAIFIHAGTNRNVQFSNCRFSIRSDANLVDTFNALDLLDANSTDHRVIVADSIFDSGIDTAVNIKGGLLKFNNCIVNCSTGVRLDGSGGKLVCEINDFSSTNVNTFIWNQLTNTQNLTLKISGSIDDAFYKHTGVGGNQWIYISSLIIYGNNYNASGLPATPYGWAGDRYYASGQTSVFVQTSGNLFTQTGAIGSVTPRVFRARHVRNWLWVTDVALPLPTNLNWIFIERNDI
jgi:hypothetical protein